MTFNKQDILDAFKRRVATRYYDGNRKIGATFPQLDWL